MALRHRGEACTLLALHLRLVLRGAGQRRLVAVRCAVLRIGLRRVRVLQGLLVVLLRRLLLRLRLRLWLLRRQRLLLVSRFVCLQVVLDVSDQRLVVSFLQAVGAAEVTRHHSGVITLHTHTHNTSTK